MPARAPTARARRLRVRRQLARAERVLLRAFDPPPRARAGRPAVSASARRTRRLLAWLGSRATRLLPAPRPVPAFPLHPSSLILPSARRLPPAAHRNSRRIRERFARELRPLPAAHRITGPAWRRSRERLARELLSLAPPPEPAAIEAPSLSLAFGKADLEFYEHLLLAAADPEVLFRVHLQIVLKTGHSRAPVPNFIQLELFRAIRYCVAAGIPCRIIGLKPRQTGLSTACIAVLYWFMRTRAHVNALSMAEVHKTIVYHSRILTHYALTDTFPWANTFAVRDRVSVCSNGARRYRDSADSKSPGVGGTFMFGHISEVAKFKSGGLKDANVFMPQMRAAFGEVPGTISIEESTPQGVGNFFEQSYNGDPGNENPLLRVGAVSLDQFRAGARGNGMIRIFAPWFRFPEYQIPLIHQNEYDALCGSLTPAEKRLIHLHGLAAEQIKWRRLQVNRLRSEALFIQEYTEDEVLCFQLSGSPRFDNAAIVRIERAAAARGHRRLCVLLGLSADGESVRPREAHESPAGYGDLVYLYEVPKPGCRYILGVDTMEGIEIVKDSNRRDYNSLVVYRLPHTAPNGLHRKGRVVARSHPRNQADPTPGARLAWLLSKYYGDCTIALEINSSGLAWLTCLKENHNANLYRRTVLDEGSSKPLRKLGWRTGDQSRKDLIEALSSALFNDEIECADPSIARQLRTFVVNARGRPEAQGGKNDDDILALALCIRLQDEATEFYRAEPEEE